MPLVLLISLTTYSQKVVLNDKGDTTICFSISQSKFLLKQAYALKECDTLKSICELQLTKCDSVFVAYDKLKKDFLLLQKNERDFSELYDAKMTDLQNALLDQILLTKKQKFQKWCAIIGGGVLSSFLAVKYIKK